MQRTNEVHTPHHPTLLQVIGHRSLLLSAPKMAAAKLISHPHYLNSIFLPSKFSQFSIAQTRLHGIGAPARPRRHVVVRASFHDPVIILTSPSPAAVVQYLQHNHGCEPSSSVFLLAESTGYSVASYYTSLGLFVISVPGLWSLIKRSVKSKIVKKTFVGEGEEKKAPNQVAGEILSFFTRNNFIVKDRGETITFEGKMTPSRGQAALLTFCTCISLASVALVLTITVPDFGNNWFWLTLLSPLAGAYYWKRASRTEEIKVKMIVADDINVSEIVVQGDDQQVEQMRKELKLSEKGMVYVKGIFERS